MHCGACGAFARMLSVIVAAGLLVGAPFVSPLALAATGVSAGASAVKRAPPSSGAAPGPATGDFASLVERYGPAVVNVSALAGADPSPPAPGLDNLEPDDSLQTFFRVVATQRQALPAAPNPPRVMWGGGSGFIIGPEGLVATTAHVVNRAEQVAVTLTDRRRLKARVLGVDPQSDVALLQIEDAAKLPFVRLGDASRVRVGQQVLTIGSPDGADNTVTSGVVSVMPRALPDGTDFPFFQTDGAINPDNSGGPVLDRNGEAIGIAVQVYTGADRFQALTFAIPVTAVAKLRMRLQGQGKMAGGSLGIEVQDVDPGLALVFGLPRAAGAIVTSVGRGTREGGAGGIRTGDVITHLNGKPIEHAGELADQASALRPGSKATLKIIRNKKPLTLTATIVAQDESVTPAPATGNELDRLGLVVRPLNEQEQGASGLAGAVVVDAVSGAAERAGIEQGDIVLSVNGTPVASRDELNSLIVKSGKDTALLIQRDDARKFILLKLR